MLARTTGVWQGGGDKVVILSAYSVGFMVVYGSVGDRAEGWRREVAIRPSFFCVLGFAGCT